MVRNMYLHQSNFTKMLRRDGWAYCKYCGTRIEFFDRYDGLRIPMSPEFPTKKIPPRLRWHIDRGIAYPGGDTRAGYCRIPHPAICPAVEHSDLPRELIEVVRVLALRMNQAISDGRFTPFEEMASEQEAESQEPEKGEETRHIVAYYGILRLGPCAIEDLQCIAEDRRTGERCESGVYNPEEGSWEQVDIDPQQATGRLGQLILDVTQGRVWAWHLHDFNIARRWWSQRCEDHWTSSSPDAVNNEFVSFHPVRHDAYILTARPTGYAPEKPNDSVVIYDGPQKCTQCARCPNGTVQSVDEGWLCWKCEREEKRRARIHKRWGVD